MNRVDGRNWASLVLPLHGLEAQDSGRAGWCRYPIPTVFPDSLFVVVIYNARALFQQRLRLHPGLWLVTAMYKSNTSWFSHQKKQPSNEL